MADEPPAETTVDGLEPVDPGLKLSDDPFDDDLAGQLRAKAPLAVTKVTVVLASLVLIVAGFVGGVLVQKNFGATASSTNRGNNLPAALASRGAGGGGTFTGGTGGVGRNGATAAPATTGKVTLVDGSTVYITTDNGDVVIVHTNTSTAVKSEQTSAVKDLAVGSTVTVSGSTGSDGSVTATQITQQK
jgi:hypothetical protein